MHKSILQNANNKQPNNTTNTAAATIRKRESRGKPITKAEILLLSDQKLLRFSGIAPTKPPPHTHFTAGLWA